MRAKRYPAEAARTLRQATRARAETKLAAALRAVTAAESVLERARAAEAVHERERGGAASPGATRGSAAELQRAAAYARAQAEIGRTLRREVREAEAALVREQREVDRARAILAEASGAERVVDRDRARFGEAVRKERERTEEADADEIAVARAKRPRGPESSA